MPDQRPVRARSSRTTTGQHAQRRPITVLQWNAEGVRLKKVPLTKKLYKEQIDIACIQEIHLNPSHGFKITGYETIRQDREGHKGGVLILIRHSLPNRMLTVHTNNQAEVVGADIYLEGDRTIRVFIIYCPPKKELALDAMEITHAHCLVVGVSNSHSDRWGYAKTDTRGAE
jgi:exonuclease III